MKMIIFGSVMLFLVFTFNFARGQSLDEILDKHYDAVGTKYLKEVQSILYYGTYKNHFLKKISENLPNNLLFPDVEITVSRSGGYLNRILDRDEPTTYGYFFGEYWKDQEGYPAEKWRPNNFDRLQIQLYLDFEGFLYNWREKGTLLRKLENIQLENKTYYRIRVITPEKDTLFYFINPKNNFLEKISFFGDLAEGEKYGSITFTDFKKVEGVQMAFNRIYNTRMLDGSFGKREVVFKKIVFNPKIDTEIFQIKSRL